MIYESRSTHSGRSVSLCGAIVLCSLNRFLANETDLFAARQQVSNVQDGPIPNMNGNVSQTVAVGDSELVSATSFGILLGLCKLNNRVQHRSA